MLKYLSQIFQLHVSFSDSHAAVYFFIEIGVVNAMLPGDVSPCTDKNSTPRLKNTITSLETVQQKLKGPVPQFFPEISIGRIVQNSAP